MERLKEKRKKQTEYKIQDASFDSQDLPSRTVNQLKRKIRKKHQKKAGRQLSIIHGQEISLIKKLMKDSPQYFQQINQTEIESTANSLKSLVHVKKIIEKQQSAFFDNKEEQCQQQAKRYWNLIKMSKTHSYEKVKLQSKQFEMAVSYLRDQNVREDKKQNSKKCYFLNSNETSIVRYRQEIKDEIREFILKFADQKGYNKVDIPDFNLEVLALAKMNNTAEAEAAEIVAKLKSRLSQSSDNQSSMKDEDRQIELRNQYIAILVFKNLSKAFNEEPIDFYNYHKQIETYEDNTFLATQFDLNKSLAQFKKYIFNKKPRKHKSTSFLLRTPCSACFSDISEMENPILNCPECNIRIHKYCQKIQTRCHRCRYGRTSNTQKNQTSFCYICNREREKGLMIQTVTNNAPHQFAHVFCLFLHNLWYVQNKQIKGKFTPQICGNEQCKICSKKIGISLFCVNCHSQFHGLCAYVEGYSFKLIKQQLKNYSIQLNCCIDLQLRQRLGFERKFKLNLQKIIFRQDEELFAYIAKQKNNDS